MRHGTPGQWWCTFGVRRGTARSNVELRILLGDGVEQYLDAQCWFAYTCWIADTCWVAGTAGPRPSEVVEALSTVVTAI